MKILKIGTTDIRGGAAGVSWEIKTYLEKQGDKVVMYVADKLSNDPQIKNIKRSRLAKILSLIFASENFYQTDWLLKTEDFIEADIIHCHNLHGRFFNLQTLKKMSLAKPLVWTLHDEWPITPHCAFTFESKENVDNFWQCPNKNTPQRILWSNEKRLMEQKREIYRQAKINIVTPCHWLADRVKKSALGHQPLKIIYNGIDTEKFKPYKKEKSRLELNLPLGKKLIFFLADAGKNNPWKGWEYTKKIIEHFKNNQDILFVCAGNDSPGKPNRQIIYLPLIKDKTLLAKYYSACDILLYSSIADNFPLVILEAMACGLPIVSFNVGGIKEALIHKKNGYVAEYKNITDLIEGFKYLLNLPENQEKEMVLNSINRINQEFSLDKMLKEYYNFYLNLLRK